MNHKDLDSWKLSMDLVTKVYNLSESFPDKEKFGLTNQIRRSAVSIPSNIAEGAARKSDREMIQFLFIALGSISELETQLMIAQRLGYLHGISIEDEIAKVRKPIVGLIKYLKSK